MVGIDVPDASRSEPRTDVVGMRRWVVPPTDTDGTAAASSRDEGRVEGLGTKVRT
jgi:hypothetical protein